MGRISNLFLTVSLAAGLASALTPAQAANTHGRHKRHHAAATIVRTRLVRGSDGRMHRVSVRHRYYEHFTGDSFAETDLTAGDVITGEDPVVRAAAIAALGN
ncbi:MAG: putative penicillin-binding protein, partial [Acidobacteriaceae bacterium]|nr:putative penicillin-binding protein [Acidobacteriaceae bacterium]